MQNAIKRKIKQLCTRAIVRAQKKRAKDQEYAEKYRKRTGLETEIVTSDREVPHRHFDALYCKRNANFLAKTLWYKVLEGTYKPAPALKFELPKPGGGKREVMQFTFPDAAVASVLNSRLTLRNLKRQSGNSFAYRPDRDVFDALLKLKAAIKPQRNFVLQLDFEKYFDKIPHPYLLKLLRTPAYLSISEMERKAVKAFLRHQYADRKSYEKEKFLRRDLGTPQGSSISLTLANLANHPLDVSLEAINGQFARYADDTVVITYSYEDAIRAYDVFNAHCQNGGLSINRMKSPGICILSDTDEEFRTIRDFKFLGYGLSTHGLMMHESVENRLKRNFSRLINLYLIHYIEKLTVRQRKRAQAKRAGEGFDWDLLGLISEIRNIIYGGLTEQQIVSFVSKGTRLPRMRGLMGFYALLDKKDALVRLDGWLASTIKQALHKRYKLFALEINLSKEDLIQGDWYEADLFNSETFKPETRLPSFVRARAAARKHVAAFGLENVEPPRYLSYY